MGPLLPHWRELARIVAPTLASDQGVSYRLGVLLHGSAGKVVAVTQAAKAMGMKLIVVDCLDLHYSSMGDICQQLTSLGKDARKFSPCFFVLRHVNFLSSWLQETSRGHPSHANAILSAVLYDLTQQSGDDPEK